jgi:hypothetical protein
VKGYVLFFIVPKIVCGIHREYLHRGTRNMRFENRVLTRVSYLRGWRESEIDGCVVHTGEMTNTYTISVREPERRRRQAKHMWALKLTLHELEARDWVLMAQDMNQ